MPPCVLRETEARLLKKYRWIFSPCWALPGNTTYIVAMNTELQPKGTGRKRRSQSADAGTGTQEETPPENSPPTAKADKRPPYDQSSPEEPAPTPVTALGETPFLCKKKRKSKEKDESEETGSENLGPEPDKTLKAGKPKGKKNRKVKIVKKSGGAEEAAPGQSPKGREVREAQQVSPPPHYRRPRGRDRGGRRAGGRSRSR